MPELVKMYIRNVALGFVVAALFTALIVWMDVAGLRHLVLETPDGPLAAGMVFFVSGTLFAGVQFAIAVMSLADRDD